MKRKFFYLANSVIFLISLVFQVTPFHQRKNLFIQTLEVVFSISMISSATTLLTALPVVSSFHSVMSERKTIFTGLQFSSF